MTIFNQIEDMCIYVRYCMCTLVLDCVTSTLDDPCTYTRGISDIFIWDAIIIVVFTVRSGRRSCRTIKFHRNKKCTFSFNCELD